MADPLFLLTFRYAAYHRFSNLRRPRKSLKTFDGFWWTVFQCLARIWKSLSNSTTGANFRFLLLVAYDLT